MNKVILLGRLTRDPEIRYTQSAEPTAIARYTLAVNRRFKKDNETDADFIFCTVFGKGAEFAERYLKKGMQIGVTGRIQVRNWEDQNGQRRWTTEVIVEEQEFTESKAAFENRMAGSGSISNAPAFEEEPGGFAPIGEPIEDDDLPF